MHGNRIYQAATMADWVYNLLRAEGSSRFHAFRVAFHAGYQTLRRRD